MLLEYQDPSGFLASTSVSTHKLAFWGYTSPPLGYTSPPFARAPGHSSPNCCLDWEVLWSWLERDGMACGQIWRGFCYTFFEETPRISCFCRWQVPFSDHILDWTSDWFTRRTECCFSSGAAYKQICQSGTQATLFVICKTTLIWVDHMGRQWDALFTSLKMRLHPVQVGFCQKIMCFAKSRVEFGQAATSCGVTPWAPLVSVRGLGWLWIKSSTCLFWWFFWSKTKWWSQVET